VLDKLKGGNWKTVTSCIVAAGVAILQYLKLIDDQTAKVLFELAAAFGLYGIRDAIKKI